MNVVGGWASLPEPGRVVDVKNLKINVGLVNLENQTNEVTNLALGLHLPVSVVQIRGQPWQPLNGQPILERLVALPVIELFVLDSLQVHAMIQLRVPALKVGDAIIVKSDIFADAQHLLVHGRPSRAKDVNGLVKQMENIEKAGDGGQTNTVGGALLIDWTRK